MIGLIVEIVILKGNSQFVFCHPVLNFGHRFTFKRLFWWILASFKDQLKVSKCLRIVVPNEWHLSYILSLWEALVVLDASSIELCDIVETKKFFSTILKLKLCHSLKSSFVSLINICNIDIVKCIFSINLLNRILGCKSHRETWFMDIEWRLIMQIFYERLFRSFCV
jgi:hypothetical protein